MIRADEAVSRKGITKLNKGLIFAGMGFELLGIMVGCIYIGAIIDKKMQWPSYAAAGLVVIGVTGWIIHVFHLLKQISAPNKTHDQNDSQP